MIKQKKAFRLFIVARLPLPTWHQRELLRPTFQVKKIYENEKRLQAGDHSLDLLAHDFEKNYNMYIFPVHWQFGQLDQHPVDGYVGVMGRGRWCCVSPTKGQTYPCCPVCVLPDIWPTQNSPLCARLSFPWSIAPPASLSSAMLTLTNTSPWRSGPPALASRTVSTEHLTNLIRSLGLWDRVFVQTEKTLMRWHSAAHQHFGVLTHECVTHLHRACLPGVKVPITGVCVHTGNLSLTTHSIRVTSCGPGSCVDAAPASLSLGWGVSTTAHIPNHWNECAGLWVGRAWPDELTVLTVSSLCFSSLCLQRMWTKISSSESLWPAAAVWCLLVATNGKRCWSLS